MISIIMPLRNEEKYLSECLDSILVQTEQNWELLAVDDGSDDSSFSILEKYAKKDARIKPLKNKGLGIIPALQTGYEKSAGTFITRMDADDKMSPRKLELLKNRVGNYGDRLATGFVQYFSENELGNGFLKYEIWLNRLTLTNLNFHEIYKECVIPSPCWMTRRSTFEKCGGFSSNRYPEDYDLCFRFYKNGLQVVGVQEVIHFWRDYPTRSSRTDPNYADNRFLELKIDYFLEIDYDQSRPLLLWGAGKKGKQTARMLLKRTIDFRWISDNKNKIGKDIYGVKPEGSEAILNIENPQILVLVAAPNEQMEIMTFLERNGRKDYFLFC